MIRLRPFHLSRVVFALICLGFTAGTLAHAATPIIEWTRQFGTSQSESGLGVITNGPNSVYISGVTRGNLGGPSFGSYDLFLSNYDAAGSQQWVKQFGSSQDEYFQNLSLDGAGNLYSAGVTTGNFAGSNIGGSDAFLTKFDSAGSLLLSRQFGTSVADGAVLTSVVASGDIYVSGGTRGALAGSSNGGDDAFVRKYDSAGNVQWTKQFGTSADDNNVYLSTDDLGNVFVIGTTRGGLGGPSAGLSDVFLRKYDTSGNTLWTKQIGSSNIDNVRGVSSDGLGNVYISGQTFGSLGASNAGSSDVFVGKYDSDGNQLWMRQFGSAAFESPNNVDTDNTGAVYITGFTEGNLQGTNIGARDAFVSKFDSLGNQLWTLQYGSAADDDGLDIASDGLGHIYVAGSTGGSLATAAIGNGDAFLIKISEVPEPSSSMLLAIAIAANLGRLRRRIS